MVIVVGEEKVIGLSLQTRTKGKRGKALRPRPAPSRVVPSRRGLVGRGASLLSSCDVAILGAAAVSTAAGGSSGRYGKGAAVGLSRLPTKIDEAYVKRG